MMGAFTIVLPNRKGQLTGYYSTDRSAITKDGSDKVSQLNDLGQVGNHVVQGTGSKQPTWFDGPSRLKFATASDTMLEKASNVFDTTTHSIFVVADDILTSGSNDLFGSNDVAAFSSNDVLLSIFNNNVRGHYFDSVGLKSITGTTAVGTGKHLFYQEVNATHLQIRLDGVDEGSVALVGKGSGSVRINLGARSNIYTEPHDGNYYTSIIFPFALSATDRIELENYFMTRLGIS